MTQKTFYHHGKRPITVKINKDNISFHYKIEDDRKFYSIPKDEWISDRTQRLDRPDNWHIHMFEKPWFNDGIKEFIDKNV